MKKKFLLLTFALTLVLGLSACGKQEESKPKDNAKVEKTAKNKHKSKKQADQTSDNVENNTSDAGSKTTTSDHKITSQNSQNDSGNSNSTSTAATPTSVKASDSNESSKSSNASTASDANKINSNDEAINLVKQQLGYANNNDVVGGAIKSVENNQPVYMVELKSFSFVVKNGGGGVLGHYKVYPDGTIKEF